MSDSQIFTNLLGEIANQLGVELTMLEGEELTFGFEDETKATISHLSERRHIALQAQLPVLENLSEEQLADLAGALLRMNPLMMAEHSMSIGIGADNTIVLSRVISQESVNAVQLADSFEELVEKGRWVSSLVEQFFAGHSVVSAKSASDSPSNLNFTRV